MFSMLGMSLSHNIHLLTMFSCCRYDRPDERHRGGRGGGGGRDRDRDRGYGGDRRR